MTAFWISLAFTVLVPIMGWVAFQTKDIKKAVEREPSVQKKISSNVFATFIFSVAVTLYLWIKGT
jgi:hypothetical protein